jgi:serine/threonine protein kinase
MPEPSPDTLTLLAKALGEKDDVRRLVGQGGFAEVYEVWDKELEQRLAVKVLRPDVAWTAGMIERFQRETRAAARLEHPNILPIHFVGEGEGLAYYAMPFVEGGGPALTPHHGQKSARRSAARRQGSRARTRTLLIQSASEQSPSSGNA